jgi:hypothetical protein
MKYLFTYKLFETKKKPLEENLILLKFKERLPEFLKFCLENIPFSKMPLSSDFTDYESYNNYIIGELTKDINKFNDYYKECIPINKKYYTYRKNQDPKFKDYKNKWYKKNSKEKEEEKNSEGYWTEERLKEKLKLKEKIREIVKNYGTINDFRKDNQALYLKALEYDWINEFFPYNKDRKESGYWTEERVKKEQEKYTTIKSFKNGSETAYSVALKNGWLLLEPIHKPWTKERCEEEAKKYKTRSLFQNGSNSAYRNSKPEWLEEWFPWKEGDRRPDGYWTKEKCKELAITCKNRRELQLKNGQAYKLANNNGWLNEWFPWKEGDDMPHGYWTKEKIREEAKKYKTRTEFQNNAHQPYKKALEMDLIDELFPWKEGDRKLRGYWTKEKCQAEELKYNSRQEFSDKNHGAYKAAWRNGWLLPENDLITKYKNELPDFFAYCQSKKYKKTNRYMANINEMPYVEKFKEFIGENNLTNNDFDLFGEWILSQDLNFIKDFKSKSIDLYRKYIDYKHYSNNIERRKQYYKDNKAAIKIRNENWYQRNKEKIDAYRKKYAEDNRQIKRQQGRDYYRANKEEILRKSYARNIKRYNENPDYRYRIDDLLDHFDLTLDNFYNNQGLLWYLVRQFKWKGLYY